MIAGVAAAGVAAIELSRQTQRGTGAQRRPAAPDLERVSLSRRPPTTSTPTGDGNEHRGETGAVLDRDPQTTWSTERYDGGLAGKPGVGIYVDARPGVAARALEIRTPEPGWTAEVYAAPNGPPEDSSDGWTRISARPPGDRAERQHSTSTAPASASATTCCGSPSCRPPGRRSCPRCTCPLSDGPSAAQSSLLAGAGRARYSFTGSLIPFSRRSPANDQR